MVADQDIAPNALQEPGANLEKIRKRHLKYLISGAPKYRAIGLAALTVVTSIYMLMMGDVGWFDKALNFFLVIETYALLAWVIQRWFYLNYRSSWLYFTFMGLDIGAYLYAIYLTGGHQSWMIFILLGRVADQVHLGIIRPLIFNHLTLLGYLLLLFYLGSVEGAVIDWQLEWVKIMVLYGTGLYISSTALPAQSIRRTMRAALVSGQHLLEALRERSRAYLEEKYRAEEQSRVKTRFLANMSHEIRTPVNGILGMVQLLRSTPLNQEQRDYLEDLHNSTGSLLSVIDHILDYNQLTQGRYHLEPCPFAFKEIVEGVVDHFSSRCQNQNLEFWINVCEKLPETLVGDPLRLRQIILNLVGNAVKFTPSGSVTIDCLLFDSSLKTKYLEHIPVHHHQHFRQLCEEPDTKVVLTFVRDTGVGVPKDKIETIFQHFSQVDESNTRAYGGAGLGLAIVKEIVELMDGAYGVNSQEGKGSVFWFGLPFLVKTSNTQMIPVKALKPKTTELKVMADDSITEEMSTLMDKWHHRVEFTNFEATLDSCLNKRALKPVLVVVCNQDQVAQISQQLPLLSTPQIRYLGFLVAPNLVKTFESLSVSLNQHQILKKPLKRDDVVAWLEQTKQPCAQTALIVQEEKRINQIFQGKNVLVAEDNKVSQMILKRLLVERGAEVSCVLHGGEAVSVMQEQQFDLVLMDVQMPVLDGLEASRRIREHEAELEQHTPIIAISASVLPNEIQHLKLAGIDGYLPKPVVIEDLIKQLDHLNLI